MTTPSLFLTHPGSAHRDEFLAIAVLLARHPDIRVERRDATPAEMEDPAVWIVDEGLRHEPALGLFDHHQMPAADGLCALSLVLMHYGLLEAARTALPWVRVTELRDVSGPGAVAAELHIPRAVLGALDSPVERALLDWFAAEREILPGQALHTALARTGQLLLEEVTAWQEAEAYLPSLLWMDVSGLRCALVQDEAVRGYTLTQVLRRRGQLPAILVSPDTRGPGWGFSRIDDHPGVDFRRISADPRISFVHGNGFVAKTSTRLDPADLRGLLLASVLLPAISGHGQQQSRPDREVV